MMRTGQPAIARRHRQHDGGGGQRRGARGNVQPDGAHRHADALAAARPARSRRAAAAGACAAWNRCTVAMARSSAACCGGAQARARPAANSAARHRERVEPTPSKRCVSSSSAASPSRRTASMMSPRLERDALRRRAAPGRSRARAALGARQRCSSRGCACWSALRPASSRPAAPARSSRPPPSAARASPRTRSRGTPHAPPPDRRGPRAE